MVTSISTSDGYQTVVENGMARITADAAVPSGGSGAFSPHELVCAGFAACLNITVRMVLERRGLAYRGVRVQVSLDNDAPAQAVYTYHVDIDADLDEVVKQEVIQKASRCPVHKTLAKAAVFQYDA